MRRPDVLFVSVDDLNDWTGCLGGHPQARTPNLDRLAARGALFTNAHCSAPLCGGSRTSLLLGVRPTTSGIYTNHQSYRSTLPDAVTLPQALRTAGYRTLGVSKIFHLRPDPSWEEWHEPEVPDPLELRPADRQGWGIPDGGLFDWGPLDVGDDALLDGQAARWAQRRLHDEGFERPLFLGVGLFRPHLPWLVPRRYFERYPWEQVALPRSPANDLDDVPAAARNLVRASDRRKITRHHQWQRAVAAYLASTAFMDVQLGTLLDAFAERERRSGREGIVVLWSDHGFHLGEKGHWRKFTLWEESTRVPLVLVAPGATRPRSRCRRAVSLLDLYPTLLELCGIEKPQALEGRSLLPLLRDPAADIPHPPAVTSIAPHDHSVRSDRWRYTRYADGSEELYDHDADPAEVSNLAGRPELASVKAEWAAWIPHHPAPPALDRRSGRPAGGRS